MFPDLSLSEHKAKLPIAAADGEYETKVVTRVEVVPVSGNTCEMYEITFDAESLLAPLGPKNADGSLVVRAPVVGDALRIYGKGIGCVVRGIGLLAPDVIAVRGSDDATFAYHEVVGLYRYATEEEEKEIHAKWVASQKDERRRKWEETKMDVAADINKLPEPFRKRFEFFMRNPSWGPEFGHYEVFVMKEAWKIYQALAAERGVRGDVTDAIHEFSTMKTDEQNKLVPDLDKDHSGNTLGAACKFAHAFAYRAEAGETAPELFQYHGSLCPLVGCEEYGCYSTTVESEEAHDVSARRAQTAYTPEEQTRMLRDMQTTSNLFYEQARRIGHHQFIEFAGFLNETIKIWKEMHDAGIDFGTTDLQAKPYQMEYIAEKFDCIFGEALLNEDNRRAFLQTLAGKGGWKL